MSDTPDGRPASASEPLEFPLSYGQQALWFLHQMAPEAVAYNRSGAVAVPGATDLDALERAFRKLADRHPMLRATFAAPVGEPVQRIHPRADVALHRHDASAWSTQQLDQELASAIYQPFDLEWRPAWRVHVFQNVRLRGEGSEVQSAPEHLLVLTFHHIIGDLWSTAIVLPEMVALYREEATGQPAKLKPLGTTYADYVERERQWLAGVRGMASWDYWREILGGELPPLELPTDRARPTVQSERGALLSFVLDRETSDRVAALASDHGVTVPAVLLAALQTLLHRYTGQSDIRTGYLKAGRSAATARVFGYFVNPIVIRGCFDEDASFRRVLQQTHRSIEASTQHDGFPFPLLVSRLRPSRDLSRPPLFQVMFSWQKTSRQAPKEHAAAFALEQSGHSADLGALPMRSVPIPHRTAFFDLTLSAGEARDGLALTLEYNTDLFDVATVEGMARGYRTLLDSACAAPDTPVSRLEILTTNDRRQLLVGWNATAAPYPEECLHHLFEKQVDQRPDVAAVVGEGRALTYQELNRRANQLAHYLSRNGVSAGSFVGLCCEPSLQTIVGALGILKAGAAYLPIDPHYPSDRQAFMLNDVQAGILVTHAAVRDRLPSFNGTIFDLDADWPTIRSQPDVNPSLLADTDGPAYAIFTSGSTGRPKGAALAHRGVVNLLTDFQARKPIAPGDACSWWTSASFDVSVYEIFSALLAGGTLHVVSQDLRLDTPALLDWMHTQRIRHAYLPPFMLGDLAAWLQRNPGQSDLRRLLVGVEPISEQLLISICAHVPDLLIINGYGPSETTICSTLYEVDRTKPARGKTPIGKPVLNTQIYVLDRHLQPVPRGVTGEVYIGGVALARGYLHRQELTRERFLPDLFTRRLGARLYRTGDLARHLPDGNLEFLGRIDDQSKINGVRIEPAEIETVLTGHPAVRSAAVIASRDEPGPRRLVAYFVPAESPPPSARELRGFLAQYLPEYMVPRIFVSLDSLPRTPSGKLDRRRLPTPDTTGSRESRPNRAAQTNTERTLASIWKRVLGTAAVGKDDNFFELGGDSIRAMQIVSQAARAGLRLSPRDLFQAPTIAGLAARADDRPHLQGRPEQADRARDFPLTPIQHWFFDQSFPNPHHWNQTLMFVTQEGMDIARLQAAVDETTAHHDALRLRFLQAPHGWRQSYPISGEVVPFEAIDLAGLADEERSTALQERAAYLQKSLHISNGPLIRVAYFSLGDDRPGRLLIVIHHLAVDAVSWSVLLEDLQAAYAQLGRGEPIRLPRKTTSYGAWAQRLTDLTRTDMLRLGTRLWSDKSAFDAPSLPLDLASADCVAALNQELSAGGLSTRLGREETRNLLRRAATGRGTRIVAILLTALARAFQRWTGFRRLRVDVEGHGRQDLSEEVDLSRTVGWFTTLCPVGIELSEAKDPGDQLSAIEGQLNHVQRDGLIYGLLRYLDPDPRASQAAKSIPPAQVCFAYLGQLGLTDGEGPIAALAPESVGAQRAPEACRPYLIEVTCAVLGGQMRIDWTYSGRLHHVETMRLVVDNFTEELRRLVDFLGSRMASGAASVDAGGDGAAFPVSPMQQGMLHHSLGAPDSGVYVQQVVSTIEGPLDIPAFSTAWKRLVERHGILRTAFVGEQLDTMLQTVHAGVDLGLSVQDWRTLEAEEQEARLERLLSVDRRRGFDLRQAPLWRLALIRTADQVHRVLFSHHHALLDGWSLGLLFRDLFALYESSVRNESASLPEARPYSDYIAWLARRDNAPAEAFWRDALAGCPLGPSLPLERKSQSPPSQADPAEQRVHLSLEETSALRTAASRRHLTLSTVLQGGWALLLARHLRQREVVFGATVASRPPELHGSERMVGLFINTLPVRVRLDPSARLSEWLEDLQRQAAEARQYADCPLVWIQTLCRARPGRPLFESVLVFENYPVDASLPAEPSGLRVTEVHAIEQTNYPLAVAVIPGRRLELKASYDRATLEPAAVERLLHELRELLASWVADPDRSLAEVARLPEDLPEQPHASATTAVHGPRAYVAPRGTLQVHLARLWADVLHVDRVGAQDDFFELGGSSLTGAVLVSKIRRELGADLPLGAFFESPTIAEQAAFLERRHPGNVASHIETRRTSPSLPSALVPIQPEGSRNPLFCVHPAGGVVFPYYALARHLPEDQPLYGLQDPSLFDSGGKFQSVEAMATHYLDVLQQIQPSGPYNLLGWSAGGVIAFEIAQQLSRKGETVGRLIILDTRAPARLDRRRLDGARFSRAFGRVVDWLQVVRSSALPIASYIRSGLFLMGASARSGRAFPADHRTIADLLAWGLLDTWRRRLLGKAEAAAAVPAASTLLLVEMPDVRRVLRMVRHHIRLARRYSAAEYPGHLAVVRAGPSRPEDSLGDGSLGWAKLASAGVDIRAVRGNHVALMVSPYVALLGQELKALLDAGPSMMGTQTDGPRGGWE